MLVSNSIPNRSTAVTALAHPYACHLLRRCLPIGSSSASKLHEDARQMHDLNVRDPGSATRLSDRVKHMLRAPAAGLPLDLALLKRAWR